MYNVNFFSAKLNYWKDFVEGKAEIHCINAMQIASKAIEDVKEANEKINSQIQEQTTLKAKSFREIYELVETIQRVVDCMVEDKFIDQGQAKEIKEENKWFHDHCDELDIEEFRPDFAIRQLKSLSPEASALKALKFAGLPNLDSEVSKRLLRNAKLISSKDVIDLFQEMEKEKNICKIVKDRLKRSQEHAFLAMNGDLVQAFDEQSKIEVRRDCIYQNKMAPCDFLGKRGRMEAWDFLKEAQLEKELDGLSEEEKIFKGYTRLYQGTKGDFFLVIDNSKMDDAKKKFLGPDLCKKLGCINNYLWSLDGKIFYLMNKTSFEGSRNGYDVSFTVEMQRAVKISVHPVYASFQGNDVYERQGLECLKNLFASFKSGECEIIPFPEARKPEYLYEIERGKYIYVDSLPSKGDDDFGVHIYSEGKYIKFDVENVTRHLSVGVTTIKLVNGDSIWAQTSTNPDCHPIYTFQGKKQILRPLDLETLYNHMPGLKIPPKTLSMLHLYSEKNKAL